MCAGCVVIFNFNVNWHFSFYVGGTFTVPSSKIEKGCLAAPKSEELRAAKAEIRPLLRARYLCPSSGVVQCIKGKTKPTVVAMASVWDTTRLRMTAILSLILQIILILLGNRRKVSKSNILRIVLWLSYTAADSVATVSLSVISSSPRDYIPAWALLILMHFGGQDTITAYSLEDNNSWHRHLLQIVWAIYLLLFYLLPYYWSADERLSSKFMVIALLIAGFIKTGERIWTMWSVSRNHLRESLLPPADPGPNYVKLTKEYMSKEEDGLVESLEKTNEAANEEESSNYTAMRNIGDMTELDILLRAKNFFGTVKPLFADLMLSFKHVQDSQSFFTNISYSEAFKVIEAELGFTYDFFYTKAVLAYSLWGVVLRFITFSCTLPIYCAVVKEMDGYFHNFEDFITYSLLVGAIVLEILSVFFQLYSDWAVLWLGKRNKQVAGFFAKRKRWSNSMAQYNLIKFCLKGRPAKWNLIQNWSTYKSVEMHLFKVTVAVPEELKDQIFQEIQKKLSDVLDLNGCKQFCAYKGDWVLGKEECLGKLGWSVEAELGRSILLWHIAIELCYNEDLNSEPNSIDNDFPCEASRLLSKYMVHILVMCPFMLPDDNGQRRLRDTCTEAIEFFKAKENGPILNENEACKKLYGVCTDVAPSIIKGDRSKSVLFDGCRLAKALQSLETELQWERARKWELISRVWIEILCYAASHSIWTGHADQLRRGGELLTHVGLLLVHFGITEHFEVSDQSHATA